MKGDVKTKQTQKTGVGPTLKTSTEQNMKV